MKALAAVLMWALSVVGSIYCHQHGMSTGSTVLAFAAVLAAFAAFDAIGD